MTSEHEYFYHIINEELKFNVIDSTTNKILKIYQFISYVGGIDVVVKRSHFVHSPEKRSIGKNTDRCVSITKNNMSRDVNQTTDLLIRIAIFIYLFGFIFMFKYISLIIKIY